MENLEIEFQELKEKYEGKRGRKPKRYHELKKMLEGSREDADKVSPVDNPDVNFDGLDIEEGDTVTMDDQSDSEGEGRKILTQTESELIQMGVDPELVAGSAEGGKELRDKILNDQINLDIIESQIDEIDFTIEQEREKAKQEKQAQGKKGRTPKTEKQRELEKRKSILEKSKSSLRDELYKNKPRYDGLLLSEISAGFYASGLALYGKFLQSLPSIVPSKKKPHPLAKLASGSKKVDWSISEKEQNQIAVAFRNYYAESDVELTPTQALLLALSKPIVFKTLQAAL